MNLVNKVDKDGYLLGTIIINDGEQIPDDCVDIEVKQGLYKPKFNKELLEWQEGEDQAVIDSYKSTRRVNEIKQRLKEIDAETIRPLRAIATGSGAQFDTDKLASLDSERATLVAEMVALNG